MERVWEDVSLQSKTAFFSTEISFPLLLDRPDGIGDGFSAVAIDPNEGNVAGESELSLQSALRDVGGLAHPLTHALTESRWKLLPGYLVMMVLPTAPSTAPIPH